MTSFMRSGQCLCLGRTALEEKQTTPDIEDVLRQLVEEVRRESRPGNPSEKFTIGEANYIHRESKAMRRKGKWPIFGP